MGRLLVDFGKIHAIGKLQSGNLFGVELHFQVSLQDGNVQRFTFRGTGALGPNPVQFHIAVMRFYKFIYDRVHGVDILLGLSLLTNHSKTLEALL
jgi:hypothetical protein